MLSQSGAFGWKPEGEKESEWLNRQFAASPRLPLRFSFEAGLMEGTWWWRNLMAQQPNAPPANLIDPTLLAANRNLRDTLQSKGYSVHYTEFNGNHGSIQLAWDAGESPDSARRYQTRAEDFCAGQNARRAILDSQESDRDSSSQSGSRSVATVRWQI